MKSGVFLGFSLYIGSFLKVKAFVKFFNNYSEISRLRSFFVSFSMNIFF